MKSYGDLGYSLLWLIPGNVAFHFVGARRSLADHIGDTEPSHARSGGMASLGGMNIGHRSLSSALVAVAAAGVLLGTLYFASL